MNHSKPAFSQEECEWFLGEVGQKERPRRGRAGDGAQLPQDHRARGPVDAEGSAGRGSLT